LVDKFTYLGSTISKKQSLDAEFNVRISKAATVMARLVKRVWDNSRVGKMPANKSIFHAGGIYW
jgi:hypothetical protein